MSRGILNMSLLILFIAALGTFALPSQLQAFQCVSLSYEDVGDNEYVPFPLSYTNRNLPFPSHNRNVRINIQFYQVNRPANRENPRENYFSHYKLTSAVNCFTLYKTSGYVSLNGSQYKFSEVLYFKQTKEILFRAHQVGYPENHLEVILRPSAMSNYYYTAKLTFICTSPDSREWFHLPSFSWPWFSFKADHPYPNQSITTVLSKIE